MKFFEYFNSQSYKLVDKDYFYKKILGNDQGDELGEINPDHTDSDIDNELDNDPVHQHIKSKSKNTPFMHYRFTGKAIAVLNNGKLSLCK